MVYTPVITGRNVLRTFIYICSSKIKKTTSIEKYNGRYQIEEQKSLHQLTWYKRERSKNSSWLLFIGLNITIFFWFKSLYIYRFCFSNGKHIPVLLVMIAHSTIQSSTWTDIIWVQLWLFSQCCFVHRHFNNAYYNKIHSFIGKLYLEINDSNGL